MKLRLFLTGCLFIFTFIFLDQKYFLPADVLNNIPSFSESGWERPKNSLLADPVYQFEPWRSFAKSELHHFRFPLWNDRNGNGAPFFANSQSAVLFPLNIIYYIFPQNLSLFTIAFVKLLLFLTFTYSYLRSIKISSTVSFIGAFALTFSGFMILWLNWPQTNVYLFLPLVLFLTEKIRTGGKQMHRVYILLALSYLFAILGGHPETLFYVFLINIVYAFVRFGKKKSKLIPFSLSILTGFLLGVVQILPFVEYLRYSNALVSRVSDLQPFFLPISSFILNFFPLLFGAPHLSFYRSISSTTNFQESAGGYVGAVAILVVIFGFYLIRKNQLAKLWFLIIIVSWAFAYRIWPLGYLSHLPLLNISTNNRLIAFAGFSVVVVFCLVIEKLLVIKIKDKKNFFFSNKFYALLSCLFIIFTIFSYLVLPPHLGKYSLHLSRYLVYVDLFFLSTIFFFWVLSRLLARKLSKNLFCFLTFLTVFSQTLFIFWNYNPTTRRNNYYPDIPVVKALEKYPQGNILEVGNPSIPANVNLIYDLPHVVNNDAVEVSWYRAAQDKAFNLKNNWGNPEEVDIDKLKDLNVTYVLSDFDINLKKIVIQPESDEVLFPLYNNLRFELKFSPKQGVIRQVRLKTASFNRNNNCHFRAQIVDKKGNEVFNSNTPCKNIRNNVFLTLPASIDINDNTSLSLIVSSDSRDPLNAVSVYGTNDMPYLELLYQLESNEFDLLAKTKTTYIWRVRGTGEIEGANNYKVLYKDPQKIVMKVNTNNNHIVVKKTYFPGWSAQVNGKKTLVENSEPFMKLKVDQGDNFITLFYKPFSFVLGLGISLMTALAMFIYLIRKEYKERSWKNTRVFLSKLRKNGEAILFWQHALVVVFGIFLSALSYLLIVFLIHPHFTVPYTTTISWVTVNKYPRQQEYFYLLTAFPYIFIVAILIWLIFVWKRKIK